MTTGRQMRRAEVEAGVCRPLKSVLVAGIAAALVWLPAAPTWGQTTQPKVLIIFIDGWIPGVLETAETPWINGLLPSAAISLEARAESTAISGSGWSSMLTGVHWDRHGVPDNGFATPRSADFPTMFGRLRELAPGLTAATCQHWQPIWTHWIATNPPALSSYHDYYGSADNFFDGDSADIECTEDVLSWIENDDPDLVLATFGDLDGVGHQFGFSAEQAPYRAMMAAVDTLIGRMLVSIRTRESAHAEDWLVILTTDHAGSGTGHGSNTTDHRLIPFIVSGGQIEPGPIWPPPQIVDVLPTAFQHLGLSIPIQWGIDGRAIPTVRRHRVALQPDTNLLFNGDAEYERGFATYNPDAAIAGWTDPGAMTVIRYEDPGLTELGCFCSAAWMMNGHSLSGCGRLPGISGLWCAVDDPVCGRAAEGPREGLATRWDYCSNAVEGFPRSADPGPVDRGNNFFVGGGLPGPSEIWQTIDLTPIRAEIERGVNFRITGWLGGYATQQDSASLLVAFYDYSGGVLETHELGPIAASERGSSTGLVYREHDGRVPSTAFSARVTLRGNWSVGANDGYADNLDFRLIWD